MDSIVYTSNFLSPLGTIEVKASDLSILSVLFIEKIIAEKPNHLTNECLKQLDEYFSKKRTSFDLPLEQEGTVFQLKIWEALKQIPFGRTFSYKELAAKTGKVGSVRAVGSANGQNQLLLVIPCHRVIGSDGNLVGYAGDLWRKEWLLKFEQGDKNGKQMGLVY